MAGIVGVASLGKNEQAPDGRTDVVRKMVGLLAHRDGYGRQVDEVDPRVAGGAALHFPSDWRSENRFSSDSCEVWLHGEIHNTSALLTDVSDKRCAEHLGQTGAAIAAAYLEGRDWDFLARADGIFCGALYDHDRGLLHLFCDRFGFRELYWGTVQGQLVWSSELKGFLAVPGFQPAIDERSLQHFMSSGYLEGRGTWFEGVQLLEPATVRSWNLRNGESSRVTYWDASKIKSIRGERKELVREMGRRIRRSVEVRARGLDSVCVTLSGGLDSRAILAAVSDRDPREQGGQRPLAVTFGRPGSDEIEVARKVAEFDGADHLIFQLREENWFDLRTQGVWWSDGLVSLAHLHAIRTQREASRLCEVNLNGFLGDAIEGGMYYQKFDGKMVEGIVSRGRRFISTALRVGDVFFKNRRPFVSNDLVELCLGLGSRLVEEPKLYHLALRREFPGYFRSIPTVETGAPVGANWWERGLAKMRKRVWRRLSRFGPIGGAPVSGPDYADYLSWLVGPTYRTAIEGILFGGRRLYPELIGSSKVRTDWKALQEGRGAHAWKYICRVLTFEIWLQQVFEGRMRPTEDPSSSFRAGSS